MSASTQSDFTIDVPRRGAPRLVVAPAGVDTAAASGDTAVDDSASRSGARPPDSERRPGAEAVAETASRRQLVARLYTWGVTAGLLCGAAYIGWTHFGEPHMRGTNAPAPVALTTTTAPVAAPVEHAPAEPSIAEMMGRTATASLPRSDSGKVQANPPVPAPAAATPTMRANSGPSAPAASAQPAPVPTQPEAASGPVAVAIDEKPAASAPVAPSAALEQRLNDLAMRLVRTEALLTALREDEKSEREASDRSIQSLRESIGAQSVRIQDLGARLDKPQETPQLSGRRATRTSMPVPHEQDDGKPAHAEAPPPPPHYHVVAGGPEMVILHGVGNNDATFALRDIVPGYGHINAIEQDGDRWIVRTDKGLIK